MHFGGERMTSEEKFKKSGWKPIIDNNDYYVVGTQDLFVIFDLKKHLYRTVKGNIKNVLKSQTAFNVMPSTIHMAIHLKLLELGEIKKEVEE